MTTVSLLYTLYSILHTILLFSQMPHFRKIVRHFFGNYPLSIFIKITNVWVLLIWLLSVFYFRLYSINLVYMSDSMVYNKLKSVA